MRAQPRLPLARARPARGPTPALHTSCCVCHMQSNLKLYVRRVMITDEFDELLPRYLGFIKGVVDSDSLPLNVSREMLQQNKVLKVIGKKMTRKALAMIKALADAEKKDDEEEGDEAVEKSDEEDEDDESGKYAEFWKAFGKYIKMGLIEDTANRTRLAKLLRYATSKSGDKEISLEEYVANMKEDQKHIYYISGEDKDALMKSPSVEKLIAMDYEIIFMTDAVDEYTVQHLTEFEGKRLINASREGLKLEEGDKDKKREDMYKDMFKPLLDYIKEILGRKVEKVLISKHLVASPVVALSADYGWTAQMEKVMKAQAFTDQSKFEFMKSKRNFGINPRHPMIIELNNKVRWRLLPWAWSSHHTVPPPPSPRPHPLYCTSRVQIKAGNANEATEDSVMSLYLSAVVGAGYPLTPEDAMDFSSRVGRIVSQNIGVPMDAELAPELEVPEDVVEDDDEEVEEEEMDGNAEKDEV
eukprot:scaffold85102_cov33-Tisochrysis_lutea.AAC.2